MPNVGKSLQSLGMRVCATVFSPMRNGFSIWMCMNGCENFHVFFPFKCILHNHINLIRPINNVWYTFCQKSKNQKSSHFFIKTEPNTVNTIFLEWFKWTILCIPFFMYILRCQHFFVVVKNYINTNITE